MAYERSEAVIALGRKLVEHLEIEPERDLLAAWMAQYLAERMDAVETASPEARAALEAQCAEAILGVWAHRHQLTPAIPAFADLRALEGAILALAPDRAPSRYFSPLRDVISANPPSTETRQWLEIAAGLDTSARELIRFCLRRAVDERLDEGEVWLDAAREALGEDGPERALVTFIRSGEDDAVVELEERTVWLKDRARQLDTLIELSAVLSQALSKGVSDAEAQLVALKGGAASNAPASPNPGKRGLRVKLVPRA